MKKLAPWIATAFLGLFLLLSAARGQQPSSGPTATPIPGQTLTPTQPESPSTVLPTGVALVFSLVIMLIVCMPSRKS